MLKNQGSTVFSTKKIPSAAFSKIIIFFSFSERNIRLAPRDREEETTMMKFSCEKALLQNAINVASRTVAQPVAKARSKRKRRRRLRRRSRGGREGRGMASRENGRWGKGGNANITKMPCVYCPFRPGKLRTRKKPLPGEGEGAEGRIPQKGGAYRRSPPGMFTPGYQ